MNTNCTKCKAPMPPIPKSKGISPLDLMAMTLTGYRCSVCDHWNDLKRRKGFKTEGVKL